MFLIVGLGNPGKKYEKTRHNLGFRTVDEFVKKNNFPDFRMSNKINALISEDIFNNQKIILAKPQTFMNNSGRAVKLLNSKFKILNSKLLVVHDDIDIPFGQVRIAKNRSAAGHKGVQSIINGFKTKDFIRLRIGIRQQKEENRKQKIEDFVLQKFNKEEEKILQRIIKKSIEAIEAILKEGLEKAMSKFNKSR